MDANLILDLSRRTLLLALVISAPVLVTALVIGLAVSLLQAATQLQEQTLTFVPKLIGIAAVVAGLGLWILNILQQFTLRLYEQIPQWVH